MWLHRGQEQISSGLTWNVTRSMMVCRTDGVGGKAPPCDQPAEPRCPYRAPPLATAIMLPGVRPSRAAIAGVSGGLPLTGVRGSFGPPEARREI